MKILGLTGSIAMGKSSVANVFRDHGIPVFDADAEVHALYDSAEGADLLKPLAPLAVQGGRIDRNILTDLILADQALLTRLESLVHQNIKNRRDRFLASAAAKGAALAVVDVPLLFETGADQTVDATIVVSAPEALQHRRALQRPRMTKERLKLILDRQMPDAEKRQRATFILENDGSLTDLQTKTEQLIESLLKHA